LLTIPRQSCLANRCQANFIAFLKEIGVNTKPTEMSFSVSRDQGVFEWAGNSLSSVFAQEENLYKLGFWRMIFDIVRFNQFALDLLADDTPTDLTIGEYLDREGYSAEFRDDYLIPMTACVWSTAADRCALEFPAVTLIRFLWNHHLLNTISERPPWMTIPGGTNQYISAVMKSFPRARLHLSTPVRSVRNDKDGKVCIKFNNGEEDVFDDVILACHAPEAYSIISGSATEQETDILAVFKTTPNKVYIHSDKSLMPKRETVWSSWNYLTSSGNNAGSTAGSLQKVSLTYSMNILQHFPRDTYGDVLVTMNPPHAPSPNLTQGEYLYHHPLYNPAAIRSQERLHEIQGKRGIWYAGAWTGYGFHEDGFASGIKVAVDGLGGSVPWKVIDAKFVRGRRPTKTLKGWLFRLLIWIVQAIILHVVRLSTTRIVAKTKAL
jgi:predicted NAD/FAD-binding protein